MNLSVRASRGDSDQRILGIGWHGGSSIRRRPDWRIIGSWRGRHAQERHDDQRFLGGRGRSVGTPAEIGDPVGVGRAHDPPTERGEHRPVTQRDADVAIGIGPLVEEDETACWGRAAIERAVDRVEDRACEARMRDPCLVHHIADVHLTPARPWHAIGPVILTVVTQRCVSNRRIAADTGIVEYLQA